MLTTCFDATFLAYFHPSWLSCFCDWTLTRPPLVPPLCFYCWPPYGCYWLFEDEWWGSRSTGANC